MTPEEDKRSAACHEAAHATVRAAKGQQRTRISLLATGTKNPVTEKHWVGQAEPLFTPMCPTAAVAGFVAETLDDDSETPVDEIMDYWTLEVRAPSDTDMNAIPKDWDERKKAVQEAFDILTREHELQAAIVADLIENEFLTDGMVYELAKKHLTR